MIPSPTLPWFELARFRRSRLTRAAVLAVAVVPLFYGALYVWANLDPTGRLDQVQAAVVNEDERIEVTGPDGEEQPVAIGRLLAGNLIGDDGKNNYDWILTDAEDAEQGLADGSYKAVLTIPENLSKAATSTSGDPAEVVQGTLDLRTNDAVNFVNGQVADRILDAARTALNQQVTETYLDNLYLGFTDIRTSLLDAADGAGQLADGAGELRTGAEELADGTGRLAAGADELAAGAGQLASAVTRLDQGASGLADGLQQLRDGTATLPRDTQRLADGSAQVAQGVAGIDAIVQEAVDAIDGGSGDAEALLRQLDGALRTLVDQCRAAEAPGVDCAQLEAASTQVGAVLANLDELVAGAGEIGEQTSRLSDGASQVAEGNRRLAAEVPTLVDAIRQAADGAGRLADGTGQLADGAQSAAGGAQELADGTRQLADGAGRLADGAGELEDGAGELRDGLGEGSEQVPDYDEDERADLAKTAATPVTDTTDRLNAVSSYGEGLAPYFIALALWVGAMAIYILLRPLSDRAVASTTGSVRIALAGLAPGAVLGLVQVVLLVAALLWLVGVGTAQPWLLVGIAALTSLVFVAINQAFIAWFGGAGRFLAIVFVCLQLTAAGGTYPVETSPAFFGFMHDLLPMTYAVHALRAASAGGTAGVGGDVAALLLFGFLSLAATAVAAWRRQRVTMTRLHPTLQV